MTLEPLNVINRGSISTHTPCVGRDVMAGLQTSKTFRFQLTRPAWGVTIGPVLFMHTQFISTHTPCVGRDTADYSIRKVEGISTHTPCVGRDLFAHCSLPPLFIFQLTRPAWGVTHLNKSQVSIVTISTHTPCVGRDSLILI